jgi:hypothetical protein
MNWKNILLPWSALKEAQKDIDSHIQFGVKQTKAVAKLQFDLSAARLKNVILKGDLDKLQAIIDALPKRSTTGRFTSKNPAEALRKLEKRLPQNEAK